MRPYVICHMMSSLDGKTDSNAIAAFGDTDLFEKTYPQLRGDAWLCGRVTLQVNFAQYADPEPFVNDGHDPAGADSVYIAKQADSWAIGADTYGQFLWNGTDVDGDEPIALVSQRASKRYLKTLRQRKVSYIVAGKDDINFSSAFAILAEQFGIETLIIEGGGHVNGGVLDAGLIDEFSLLLMPGVDGRQGPSTSFDGRPASPVTSFPASCIPLNVWRMMSSGCATTLRPRQSEGGEARGTSPKLGG